MQTKTCFHMFPILVDGNVLVLKNVAYFYVLRVFFLNVIQSNQRITNGYSKRRTFYTHTRKLL